MCAGMRGRVQACVCTRADACEWTWAHLRFLVEVDKHYPVLRWPRNQSAFHIHVAAAVEVPASDSV